MTPETADTVDSETPRKRKAHRKGNRTLGGDQTVLKPDEIIKVDNPLPGENEPLKYEDWKDCPVDEQAALGVSRRRQRWQMRKKGIPAAQAEQELPTALPAWTEPKASVMLRLPPRLKMLVDAHAEAEGSNFAATVDEVLTMLVSKPPRDPAEVARNRKQIAAKTIGLDKFEQQLRAEANPDPKLWDALSKLRSEILSQE